jgi:hypothetical protein
VFICNITHLCGAPRYMKHNACVCGHIIIICKISCLCEIHHACVYQILFAKTWQITDNFDLRSYSVE